MSTVQKIEGLSAFITQKEHEVAQDKATIRKCQGRLAENKKKLAEAKAVFKQALEDYLSGEAVAELDAMPPLGVTHNETSGEN